MYKRQLLQETESGEPTEQSMKECVNEFPYEMEFSGSTGLIMVKVNATVKAWNGSLPVYRVAPHIIGQEEVQKWADVFFEGKPAYDKKIEMSKTEIENKILQLKQEMDEESLQEEYGADPEMLKYAKEYYQEQLTLYEELYETCLLYTSYTLGRLSRENPQNSDYQEVLAGIKAGEIRVTDIQFGLVRIQIPNNYDEFRLVPAWSFRGIESLDTGGGHYWYEDLDQDALSRTEHVYQTINAVDGTYINVRLG